MLGILPTYDLQGDNYKVSTNATGNKLWNGVDIANFNASRTGDGSVNRLQGLLNDYYDDPVNTPNTRMTPEQEAYARKTIGNDAFNRGNSTDYNLQAWMDRYGNDPEAITNVKNGGHFNDIGKYVNHPTRSDEAASSDILLRPGGKWTQAEDNVWEFAPGADQQGLSALVKTHDYLAYGNNHVKTSDDITRMVLPNGHVVSPR
jgi:hypothetical protein